MGVDHPVSRIRSAPGPQQVVPIHDFYLTEAGRSFVVGMAKMVLAEDGIEVVPLDWGDSFTV